MNYITPLFVLACITIVFVVGLITFNELNNTNTNTFSCSYWNENKTECFCGDTFDNGVYEYMWMGKVIGSHVGGDMCCPDIREECWEIK
jgi:hypothetical protein